MVLFGIRSRCRLTSSLSTVKPGIQWPITLRSFGSSTSVPATPMMRQYNKAKFEHPGFMVLFRSGDFFEIFNEDAVEASACLGITLTQRRISRNQQSIPMCGIPHHALETYLPRLINFGIRVAICDQLETRAEADARSQSLIRRGVVRLVTPGTVTEDSLLSPSQNNFLASLSIVPPSVGQMVGKSNRTSKNQLVGLSWYDLSTGELGSTEASSDRVLSELSRIGPVELVVPRNLLIHPPDGVELLVGDSKWKDVNSIHQLETSVLEDCITVVRSDDKFTKRGINNYLDQLEELQSSYIATRSRITQQAIYGLLDYVIYTQLGNVPAISTSTGTLQLQSPTSNRNQDSWVPPPPMVIDPFAFASLEITKTYSGHRKGSLLSIIDKTVTPGGARLLRSRLSSPLTDPNAIRDRLQVVRYFTKSHIQSMRTRELLKASGDLKRCLQRVELGRALPRDIWAIGQTVKMGQNLIDLFESCDDYATKENASTRINNYETLSGILQLVRGGEFGNSSTSNLSQLVADISLALGSNEDNENGTDTSVRSLAQGGYLKVGYDDELDRLRNMSQHKDQVVEALIEKYRRSTGVQNIKVKRNVVMGAFLEVPTRAADSFLPPEFTQVKVLKNVVRFKTTELYKLEGELQQADFLISQLELKLFRELCEKVIACGPALRSVGDGLERLDVASNFGYLANEANLIEPEIIDGPATPFHIEGGRHLVVESLQRAEVSQMVQYSADSTTNVVKPTQKQMHAPTFVGNDLKLSGNSSPEKEAYPSCMLLTGPNMAGKSTFLRQNAHIAILSHIGSFVPALRARIGVVDKLFTRIGSSDELVADRSTFMVEMEETAAILANATDRSLVIIDEVGRGTSTKDGIAIAWSVLEELLRIGSRTLFATHFHRLADLAMLQNSSTVTENIPGYEETLRNSTGSTLECWHMGTATVDGVSEDIAGTDKGSVHPYQAPIVFTYKVEPGVADQSYGVHCAALAGVPANVIQRASQLLECNELRDM